MNKTITWSIRLIVFIVICGLLIADLGLKKTALPVTKPSIDDFIHKSFAKKRANEEFAANRDYEDYDKFGSIIFCNTSFSSWIELVNYSKQMDLHFFGKDVDLSKWDNAIKDYENERSKCRDFKS